MTSSLSYHRQESETVSLSSKVAAAVFGSLGSLVALLVLGVFVVAIVIAYKKYE